MNTTLVSKVIAGWLAPIRRAEVGSGHRRRPNKSSDGQVGKRGERERENRERGERRKETNSVLAQSHAKVDLGNLPQDVNTYKYKHVIREIWLNKRLNRRNNIVRT